MPSSSRPQIARLVQHDAVSIDWTWLTHYPPPLPPHPSTPPTTCVRLSPWGGTHANASHARARSRLLDLHLLREDWHRESAYRGSKLSSSSDSSTLATECELPGMTGKAVCTLLTERVHQPSYTLSNTTRPVIVLRVGNYSVMRRRRDATDDGRCAPLGCHDPMDSWGNRFSAYASARAAAIAGSLDFVLPRELCQPGMYDSNLLAVLPAVVVAGGEWRAGAAVGRGSLAHARGENPSGVVVGAGASRASHNKPNLSLAAEVACRHDFRGTGHAVVQAWLGYMPTFRRELRRGLAEWARCVGFPRAAEGPIDDVAIHVRLADAAEQRKRDYGLPPLSSIAARIPQCTRVTVGLITQAHIDACRAVHEGRFSGWEAHGSGTRHGIVADNACASAALIDELIVQLRRARPLARFVVRATDGSIGAMYRLVFAPVATICSTSTFCLWPTLAANRGWLHWNTHITHHKDALETALPLLNVVGDANGMPSFVSFASMPMSPANGRTAAKMMAMRHWLRSQHPPLARAIGNGSCVTGA